MPSDPDRLTAGVVPTAAEEQDRQASGPVPQRDQVQESRVRPVGSVAELLTPARRRELGRIALVGVVTLLYWVGILPLWSLRVPTG